MKKRIYMIDYLKALCVIMVVITHYDWTDKINAAFLFGINMAVPIFMLISGYNFAASGERKAEGNFAKMYRTDMLIPRIIRFTTPFLFVYILEIILKIAQGNEYTVWQVIGRFFEGGYGPGSYYYPLMLQLIVVFPIVFVLVKKLNTWGVVAAGGLNLLYEIMINTMGVEWGAYRLLLFRYTLLLAMGCWLYFNMEKHINTVLLIAMMCVGIGFLFVIYYMGYEPKLFTYWTRTCMITAFYIFPLFYLALRHGMNLQIPGKIGNAIAKIGQASYHIFLTQMVYFHFDFCNIFEPMPGITEVAVHVIISVSIGYLFYALESRLSNWLIKAYSNRKKIYTRRAYALQREPKES